MSRDLMVAFGCTALFVTLISVNIDVAVLPRNDPLTIIFSNYTSTVTKTTTTTIAVLQQSWFSEISAIASAVAAIISVGIAAYLASKREGPDITLEDEPFVLGLVEEEKEVNDGGELLFTNYGQKAGSLVSITVVGGTETTDPFGWNETAKARRGKLSVDESELPKLIQPYDTVKVKFTFSIVSEIPMGDLFKRLSEEEKRFEFLYTTTTRKGQDTRTGYINVDLPTTNGEIL